MTPYKALGALGVTIVALYLLQVFPFPGFYLMLFGAGFLTGLLVHVLMVCILALSAGRLVTRWLVLVPVVFYGGYYAAFFLQGRMVARVEAKITATNVGKVLDFDPNRQSLVLHWDDQSFVERFDIPAVYFPSDINRNGWWGYFLADADQCGKETVRCVQTNLTPVRIEKERFCKIDVDAKPPHERVNIRQNVDKTSAWEKLLGASHDAMVVSIAGHRIGSYDTATVGRLTGIPMLYAGCILNDAASSWDCRITFFTHTLTFPPDGPDRVADSDLPAVLLGIEPRAASNLSHAITPANDELLSASSGFLVARGCSKENSN